MQKHNYFFLFLFFALISGGLQAQVVTIPDANFLAKLIQQGVDTNGDGQIQQTEANSVTSLTFTSSLISSLVGIEYFVNLQTLNCADNQLSNLDVSTLTNLLNLDCSYNQLSALDVSTLTNLQILYCSYNYPLTTMNVSGLTDLKKLYCYSTSIGSLDVTNLNSLDTLYCYNTSLTTLDVNNLANLQTLYCYGTSLTSLDVNGASNLQTLKCGASSLISLSVNGAANLEFLSCTNSNISTLNVTGLVNLQTLNSVNNSQISSLDVSTLVSLQNLNCSNCSQITTLDVSTLVNLKYLNCTSTQITTLDISALINLENVLCNYNQLTTLNVGNLANLQTIACHHNQLATLDVSGAVNLQVLNCSDNQLISLNIKNGQADDITFTNNLNVHYICIDTADLSLIQTRISQYGLQNIVVNGFCTYSPNGSYNTLSGRVTYDVDVNGCSPTDPVYYPLSIAITNGVDSDHVYSNPNGIYTTFLGTSNYTLTPQFQNAYFSINPATLALNFPNNNNNTQMQDFCISSNGVFPDVEVTISPLTVARPGFDATYKILFHNKGTTITNGNVTLDFMGNKMSLVSSSLAPSSQMTNQLTWAYSNLQPFESRSITLVFNILPPPTNNIGDILNFNTNISLANDADISDNTFLFNQDVIGAYDPNDKTCLEGNLVNNLKIGEYLHYLIRFQNTGNYPAENVVIVDSLDASKYDIASFQILETSHETHIDMKNNVLQFYFENIQLADSFSNEPASHGYVLFKIKTKATLPQNSAVSNKAEIYFDFNPPVITNTETTTFANGVAIDNTLTSVHFQCFPNPAHNLLSIKTSRPIEIEIVNVLGERLISKRVQDKENIDISALASGMYWIKERNAGAGQIFVKE